MLGEVGLVFGQGLLLPDAHLADLFEVHEGTDRRIDRAADDRAHGQAHQVEGAQKAVDHEGDLGELSFIEEAFGPGQFSILYPVGDDLLELLIEVFLAKRLLLGLPVGLRVGDVTVAELEHVVGQTRRLLL